MKKVGASGGRLEKRADIPASLASDSPGIRTPERHRRRKARRRLVLPHNRLREAFLPLRSGAVDPATIRTDHARGGRTGPFVRKAVVHGDDPYSSRLSSHLQIRLVIPPGDLGPFTAVPTPVDRVEEDPRPHARQLLGEMGIRSRRAARIRPQIVADQPSHARSGEFKSAQRRHCVVLYLSRAAAV